MANHDESREVMTPLGEMGVGNITVQCFRHAASNKTFSQDCGGLNQRKSISLKLPPLRSLLRFSCQSLAIQPAVSLTLKKTLTK